jgi:hypothetical protein
MIAGGIGYQNYKIKLKCYDGTPSCTSGWPCMGLKLKCDTKFDKKVKMPKIEMRSNNGSGKTSHRRKNTVERGAVGRKKLMAKLGCHMSHIKWKYSKKRTLKNLFPVHIPNSILKRNMIFSCEIIFLKLQK